MIKNHQTKTNEKDRTRRSALSLFMCEIRLMTAPPFSFSPPAHITDQAGGVMDEKEEQTGGQREKQEE